MANAPDHMSQDAPPAANLTPLQGAAVLAALMVALAALIGIGLSLELSAPYGGFLFVFYWVGMCHSNMKQFVPAVIGALGGLALSYGFRILPLEFGSLLGSTLALCLLALAFYVLIMNWLPILVNQAFMLFLTVGNIPLLLNETTLSAMALSVVVAAVFAGVLMSLRNKLAARSPTARHAAATAGMSVERS